MIVRVTFILIFLFSLQVHVRGQVRKCGTASYLQQKIQKDSLFLMKQQVIKSRIEERVRMPVMQKTLTAYIIPVVVHVLYGLKQENISDAQIKSQIDVLNEDYGRTNPDSVNTPGAFKGVAGAAPLQFCLAQTDPAGKRTSGIIRKATFVKKYNMDNDAAKFDSTSGSTGWDSKQYLNIWVVAGITNSGNENILGYSSAIGDDPRKDGVVIRYDCFGRTGTLSSFYNKGRTATHEIGHWFDLQHIWGDDTDCLGTDLILDTPNQNTESIGQPAFPKTDNCSPVFPGIMFMNYMDYTDDNAMNMFSAGQVERMMATLDLYRPELKTTSCAAPDISVENIYPNPTEGLVYVDVLPGTYKTINIKVYNLMGAVVSRDFDSTITKGRYVLDLSGLVNGCYFISAETDATVRTGKIILWRNY